MRDIYNGLKWTGFLAESHLFAFNTLRIVYSVEKTLIIDCITHLLQITLHMECCLIERYPIWFTDVFSKFIFILSTICGTRAVEAISCVQKSKKHFKIRLRQTVTNVWISLLQALGEVKTNWPRASQIRRNYCPVNKDAVAVQRSHWPRAKWDHTYWTFYDKPWGIRLAAIFWSFVAEAKFGLPLLSSGVFKEFETRQQKKNWVLN